LHPDTKHFSVQGFDRQGKPLAQFLIRKTLILSLNLEYGKWSTPDLAAAEKAETWHASRKQPASRCKCHTPIWAGTRACLLLIDKDRAVWKIQSTALATTCRQIVLWSALLDG